MTREEIEQTDEYEKYFDDLSEYYCDSIEARNQIDLFTDEELEDRLFGE